MKANEARKLTEENQITLDKAIDSIHSSASSGCGVMSFINLGHDVMTQLIGLGYKVSLFTDPVTADKVHRVEW